MRPRLPGTLLASSSFRLAFVYMGLFGLSVLVLLGFIYWSTAGYMARQTDQTIEAEIQGLAEQYRRRGLAGLTSLIAERLRRDPEGSSVYLLADRRFTPLLGNLPAWPHGDSDGEWIEFRLPARAGGADSRPARARQFSLRGGFHLLVGRDIQELAAVQTLITRALAGGLGITLVLALIGGSTMSRSMLRRIESINETSRVIMGGELSRRIPTDGSGDDFDQLATHLNAMLDRIEVLMDDVRRVSDNIAHDLRTPLARLRNRLEGLQKDSDGPAVRQAITEADLLLDTFSALLKIARIESGQSLDKDDSIDLESLIIDVVELYEPLVEARAQHLQTDLAPGLLVHGERNLLFQAIANLLDNAVKYAPRGGHVRVCVRESGDSARVEITDTGPGIPVSLRDKVLQRFYRGDASRSTPGSGLGLSLVAAVARRHGASIEMEDNHPGLRITLSLPCITPAKAHDSKPDPTGDPEDPTETLESRPPAPHPAPACRRRA